MNHVVVGRPLFLFTATRAIRHVVGLPGPLSGLEIREAGFEPATVAFKARCSTN